MRKKFKNKVHEGIVPLYGIYVYYSKDSKNIVEMYDAVPPSNFNGFCVWDDDNFNLGIHVPHDNGAIAIPTLCHEVFHASMKIGEMVGLEPTLGANEEIAYIVSWLTGWVMDCIDKDCKNNK